MADEVEVIVGDIEAGYADLVAELSKAAAKFATQRRAFARHVEGEEGRFWLRHAALMEQQAAQDAAERGAVANAPPEEEARE